MSVESITYALEPEVLLSAKRLHHDGEQWLSELNPSNPHLIREKFLKAFAIAPHSEHYIARLVSVLVYIGKYSGDIKDGKPLAA